MCALRSCQVLWSRTGQHGHVLCYSANGVFMCDVFCMCAPVRSFAYLTIRDRLPTILTKVIDTIHRNKNKFFEEYGEVRHVQCARKPKQLSCENVYKGLVCIMDLAEANSS